MKNLPKHIYSITSDNISIENNKKHITYKVNANGEDETIINVDRPNYSKSHCSKEILDNSNNFVYGYKVVLTANNEYAYIRESDNTLLPYRYDVATNFNQYGLAMVGKNGSVSWIDTSFNYFNIYGKMIEDNLDSCCDIFNGWQEIYEFSKGNVPLSKLHNNMDTYSKLAYMDTKKKFKSFYQYNTKKDIVFPKNLFSNGTTFNEYGYAIADGYILTDQGYLLKIEDLIQICQQNDFLPQINEVVKNDLSKKKLLTRNIKNNI